MDDFSTPGFVNIYGIPASPFNFIQPGKFPLSSMMPSILVDKSGNPSLVIGGAGGSRIPTGVAFSMIKHLFMNESLKDAVNSRRLHHQLAPMNLLYETDFDMEIITELNQKFGHKIIENKPDGGFAAVVGIAKRNGKIEGVIDPRRGGGVEIF
jgi:gamma-glutamyltranspeptidase / glutathione hydrolase / leukotriene-C4 hydrolase